MSRPDFAFANHGSVCILTPLTDAAEAWCDQNLGGEVMTFGQGIVIEPRYAGAILEGIAGEGFTFRK